MPIHATTEFYFFVGVVEASCGYSGQDSTGVGLSGSIRLSGSLVSTMILLDSGSAFPDSTTYSVYCGSVKIGSFCPDSPLPKEEIEKVLCEGYPVYCLKMAALGTSSEGTIIFLVLRATCLEDHIFERIGLLVADSLDDSERRAFHKRIGNHSAERNIILI
jgi:hypothetical protein